MSQELTLAVEKLGAGPPVIILHGLLGRGRNWLSIARSLQERHAVHLLDLRNHGASPWADTMSYAAMAGDLAAYIAAEGLERPVVIGHSMGGKAAMTLALTRPAAVGRLVVVDIAPVEYRHGGFEHYIRAMQAVDLGAATRRAEADAALAQAVPDPAMRGFLLQNLATTDGRLGWQPNLAVLLARMRELTGFPADLAGRTYDGPAFCIRGATSDYVGDDGIAAWRRHFPQGEVFTVPGAGHWPHAEKPGPFLDILAPLLAA